MSVGRPVRAISLAAALVAAGVLVLGPAATTRVTDAAPRAQGDGPPALDPFMPAPPFTLPTTSGIVAFGGPRDHSTVFLSRNPLGSTAPALWAGAVGKLIAHSPPDARYVVMSYGETPAETAADRAEWQARVETALSEAGLDGAAADAWRERFHYVDGNPLLAAGAAPSVLRAWGETAAAIHVGAADALSGALSIDAFGVTDTGWATPLTTTVHYRLTDWGGDGLACAGSRPTGAVTGTMVLIKRGVCPLVDKIGSAAAAGAAGVLMYTVGRPKLRLPNTCGPCPKMHVTMIDEAPGTAIAQHFAQAPGAELTATLTPKPLGVDAFAIDHRGRMREFGSIPFGFNADLGANAVDALHSVALEAQLYRHEALRDARLAAEDASGRTQTVTVWDDVWMADPSWSGQRFTADVALPDAAAMRRYDKLEIDLELKCDGGNRKGRCRAWDYLVNMYLCDAAQPTRCGTEFGRWVTPYSSGGRWVMDATPLLALIADGGTRRFAFATIQRYQVTVRLRLTDTGAADAPKAAVPLVGGGAFARDYNKGRRPLTFDAPAWATRVEVAAIVSGHGWGRDMANCAEFCNHTHHFQVNAGQRHIKAHPETDDIVGCVKQVPAGVTPNQAGTWVYGRGGWCPGQDVPPWRADVTADVRLGAANAITYRGLFRKAGETDQSGGSDVDYVAEPNPEAADSGFDARIDLASWLVYYGPKSLDVAPNSVPWPRQPRVWLPALWRAFTLGNGP